MAWKKKKEKRKKRVEGGKISQQIGWKKERTYAFHRCVRAYAKAHGG
jgi:hypothetical protein